jgi:hypothetical protein
VIATALAFACVVSAASAMEVKDVIKLSKLQLEDEVIMAQIRAKRATFTLSTEQIVQLKKEGVSDRLIKFMIETAETYPAKPAEKKAATETKPAEKKSEAAGEKKKEAQPKEEATAGGVGSLVLENLDSKSYSVQVDAEHGRIFYWIAVSSEGRDVLPAKSSLVYRISAGSYALRWVGGSAAHTVKVIAGKTSRAVLTRVDTEQVEAVYLSIYEDGVRRGGGRLKKLEDKSAAASTAIAAPAATTVVEKHYYHSTPQTAYVVTEPAPRYHYRSRYYSRRYYHYPSIGFAYGWKRGKSRYIIGLSSRGGLGFTYGRKLGRGGYAISLGW